MTMRDRRQSFFEGKMDDLEAFKKGFIRSGASVTGFQAEIFLRWKAHFPATQLRHFYLDEIAASPNRTRRKIISFLGGDPTKKSGDLEPGYNSKSARGKAEMPAEIREYLIDFFAEDMRASPKVFGPRARSWLTRYGLSRAEDDEQEHDSEAQEPRL
jgi:hypothetical protein